MLNYAIEETLEGFSVWAVEETAFGDHTEVSFVTRSWAEVVEWFATWGIVPRRPSVSGEISTPPLTYKPFAGL